ncbi:hypothetical protein [Sphaerisporangium sp. TRM90804]|uniref:hypothetical protein n=1 Tax=Sphaerisporangium sp. TRM90804 TaxID=3031113 RepID=UPI00244B0E33|nr:hypothetical protein [Sphaerisporangium sp. TRM90804]MDH2429246.1 hypothetical protein [Sphaerisporangium sp. TRM90804]
MPDFKKYAALLAVAVALTGGFATLGAIAAASADASTAGWGWGGDDEDDEGGDEGGFGDLLGGIGIGTGSGTGDDGVGDDDNTPVRAGLHEAHA